jgi:hypothetical protein
MVTFSLVTLINAKSINPVFRAPRSGMATDSFQEVEQILPYMELSSIDQ